MIGGILMSICDEQTKAGSLQVCPRSSLSPPTTARLRRYVSRGSCAVNVSLYSGSRAGVVNSVFISFVTEDVEAGCSILRSRNAIVAEGQCIGMYSV